LVAKAARSGYVNDAAFALGKARSLTARGYGARRVAQALHAAGIDESDGQAARDHTADDRVEAALRFARRRRFGPFATKPAIPEQNEKALAAMVRAGHDFRLAKLILALPPGADVDLEALTDKP
jgi:regulatory protein